MLGEEAVTRLPRKKRKGKKKKKGKRQPVPSDRSAGRF